MRIYLDTSVLVSALSKELASATVQGWLVRHDHERLGISDWVVTEVSSALALKLRMHVISFEERAAALSAFETLTASLEIIAVDRAAFRAAARLADQVGLGLRGGDALHLALCRAHAPILCSLDRRLLAAAEAIGLRPVRPADSISET